MPERESPAFQFIRSVDEKHEAGHKRLRVDWRDHDDRLDRIEKSLQAIEFQLKMMATTPQDFSKLTASSGVVVTIVLAVVGIVGGQVATTWGMRSDIRDISTRIEAAAKHDADSQRLQEERFRVMGVQIDSVVKKQELNQLEIQNLRETILGKRQAR